MNWDEKAAARFDPGDYSTPLATYLGGVNDLRNHLLSDETVERAARALLAYEEGANGITWEVLGEYERDVHLSAARVVLTAATGGDDD